MRDGLLAVRGVTAVHNLHIWALTANQAVLTAHVAIGEEELGAAIITLILLAKSGHFGCSQLQRPVWVRLGLKVGFRSGFRVRGLSFSA